MIDILRLVNYRGRSLSQRSHPFTLLMRDGMSRRLSQFNVPYTPLRIVSGKYVSRSYTTHRRQTDLLSFMR